MNMSYFFVRWYLGSALRSGKLKIKVLRNSTESNISPIANGVATALERIPDASKPVNNNTLCILTFVFNKNIQHPYNFSFVLLS